MSKLFLGIFLLSAVAEGLRQDGDIFKAPESAGTFVKDFASQYKSNCEAAGIEPNQDVLAELAREKKKGPMAPMKLIFGKESSKVPSLFPLYDILMNDDCKVKVLDLSQDRLRTNHPPGAGDMNCKLLKNILKKNRTIEELYLDGNGITKEGLRHLLKGLQVNTVIKKVSLSWNSLGDGELIRKMLSTKVSTKVVDKTGKELSFLDKMKQNINSKTPMYPMPMLDVSYCELGVDGAKEVLSLIDDKTVEQEVFQKEKNTIFVYGNFLVAEVWNAITHGFGIILSIVFTAMIGARVSNFPIEIQIAVTLFCIGLFMVFIGSTLYHSLTQLEGVVKIFQIIDHCAIYLLIMGSYAPFCYWLGSRGAMLTLNAVWLIGISGLVGHVVSRSYPIGQHPMFIYTELCLYVIMGLSCLIFAYKDFAELPPYPFYYLVLGGVCYLLGVPFFVTSSINPIWHVIWHVWVILGASSHWYAVYKLLELGPEAYLKQQEKVAALEKTLE